MHRTMVARGGRPAVLWLALVAGVTMAAPSEAPPQRIAVLEFRGKGLANDVLVSMADEARAGVLDAIGERRILVMSRENMASLLKDMGKANCGEGECEVETARNIGADYVVTGEVVLVDGDYRVTLKLHASASGALLATGKVKGRKQGEALDALAPAARELVLKALGAAAQSSRPDAPLQAPPPTASQSTTSEETLSAAAMSLHQQAQRAKQAGRFEAAKSSYQAAAKAYREVLERYPQSARALELEYWLADCLYSSLQFTEAAQRFARVRDHSQDAVRADDAGYSAVLALQHEVEAQQAAGTATRYPVLKANERTSPAPARVELSPLERALVDAADAWLTKAAAADAKRPGVAYKTAELFYTHDQLEEARRRFEQVVASAPKSPEALYAVDLLVEAALIDADWKAFQEGCSRLLPGLAPNSEVGAKLTRFNQGAQFKVAEQLMSQQRYDEAAARWLALVQENPRNDFADKALNNAAVCYENVQRFDSAVRLYERIVSEYPGSALAPAALFRVAINAERSYDFDKAVTQYLRLTSAYPKAKDREAALSNAARLLEGLARNAQAAELWQRLATEYPASEDAPKAQFRAALQLERLGDDARAVAAFEGFATKFAGAAESRELAFDARRRAGDANLRLKRTDAARKAWQWVADEFDRRNLHPEQQPFAAEAAAVSRFALAELAFAEFDARWLAGTAAEQAKLLKEKTEAGRRAAGLYELVARYRRPEWTLAAGYRKGAIFESTSRAILHAPVPAEVAKLGEEAVAAYQDRWSQLTVPLDDGAVEAWEATLAVARKARVSNEWTRKTLEGLNRYRPKDYPILRASRGVLVGEGPRGPQPDEDSVRVRIANDPASLELRVTLAWLLASNGHGEAAMAEAKKVLKADERNVAAMVVLASLYKADGKLQLARLVLENARTVDAQSAEAQHALGLCLLALKERPGALEALRTAASLAPGNAAFRNDLGVVLIDEQDGEAALGELEAAVTSEPSLAAAYLNLGNAQRLLMRLPEALSSYEQALRLRPQLADTHFNLGVLYLDSVMPGLDRTQSLEKSLGAFNEYLRRGGRDERVGQYVKDAQVAMDKEARRLERERRDGARQRLP